MPPSIASGPALHWQNLTAWYSPAAVQTSGDNTRFLGSQVAVKYSVNGVLVLWWRRKDSRQLRRIRNAKSVSPRAELPAGPN